MESKAAAMTDQEDDKEPRRGEGERSSDVAASKPSNFLEPWLQRELQDMHSDLLNERLPNDIEQLAQALGKRMGRGGARGRSENQEGDG